MRRRLVILRTAALIVVHLTLIASIVSCAPDNYDLPDGLFAVIETNKGDIVIQLEPDRAPLTTMNFVGLAEGSISSSRNGQPFYDGLTFHRVVPDFVIQGGDPNGNGTGGPGYQFPNETHPDLLHNSEGVVAMANSGPDTNGSQFYITLAPTPHLDGGYNVFGHVIRGMDVVREIEVGDVMRKVRIVRVGTAAQAYQPSDEKFQALVAGVAEKRAAAAARQRTADEQTIADKWPNAEMLDERGLLLERTAQGAGRLPAQGDTVSVHFTLELVDGTQVDDTRARGVPYTFVFGEERLIPGLELAIGSMRAGAKATAIVPPELAFGSTGVPPAIQPNSYIVFRIEVVDIE